MNSGKKDSILFIGKQTGKSVLRDMVIKYAEDNDMNIVYQEKVDKITGLDFSHIYIDECVSIREGEPNELISKA